MMQLRNCLPWVLEIGQNTIMWAAEIQNTSALENMASVRSNRDRDDLYHITMAVCTLQQLCSLASSVVE